MADEGQRFPRWMAEFAGRKWGQWFSRRVFTPLDKLVYRITRGRRGLSPRRAVLLLTTTGRKSGQARQTPVLYLREGDKLWVMASNYGQPHHPAWSSNLLADPNARVTIGDVTQTVRARLASEEEKKEKWPDLVKLYPAWRSYATWTDRSFRLFCLEPRDGEPAPVSGIDSAR